MKRRMLEGQALLEAAALWLHGQGCVAQPPGHYPNGFDVCVNREMFLRKASSLIAAMTDPNEPPLPPCPLCDSPVTASLGEGEPHPTAFSLFPCGHRVSAPTTVEEYATAMLRYLGYQR